MLGREIQTPYMLALSPYTWTEDVFQFHPVGSLLIVCYGKLEEHHLKGEVISLAQIK